MPVNPNTGQILSTDADGVIRGPITPQGTRLPVGDLRGQGQGDIGNAVNNVLNRLFGPRQ